MTSDDSSDHPKHVVYTRYDKTCAECGAPFVAKRVDARFCGGTCHREWYNRENADMIRERRKNYRDAHKEEQRARAHAHYEKNGEEVLARNRQRRILASPEEAAELQEKKREWYQANRERILERAKDKRQRERGYRKLSAHGTDYDGLIAALWDVQDGKCYLCRDPLLRDQPREVHLDHDHRCCQLAKSCERCRRGLACRRCNYLIGLAKDDPDCLRRIADGLEKAISGVTVRLEVPRQERERTSYAPNCDHCGQPFEAFRSDTRYCSKRCMNYASLQRRGLRAPRTPTPAIPRLPQVPQVAECAECGESFTQDDSAAPCCSKRCAQRAYDRAYRARRSAKTP
jgi:endogenous inhibitor of DNA gyrase (YacG/DUF329 family)